MSAPQEFKDRAQSASSEAEAEVLTLSHSIHAEPELGLEEYKTQKKLVDFLTSHGFTVDTGLAGLETSFVASAGTGELVIGICAEMDALPHIGHACGHNVIASAAMMAAVTLRPLVDDLGITLKIFGTPAEEFAGGKILMMDAGVFDGVHAAMMVHPSTDEYPDHFTRAITGLKVTYSGVSAHAAQAPEEGINAADAATVAQVAIGLLRQHLPAGALVHGIITEGGEASNVVPSRTVLTYDIRANDLTSLDVVREKVTRCFEAGALATGCDVSVEEEWPAFSEFKNDSAMVDFYRDNALALGRVFGEAPTDQRLREASSTDMANVSLRIPSIHPTLRLDSAYGNHHPKFAEAAGSPSGDSAVVDGGLAMAWTVIDLATDPAQRERLISKEQS